MYMNLEDDKASSLKKSILQIPKLNKNYNKKTEVVHNF